MQAAKLMKHYVKIITTLVALLGQGCSLADTQFESVLRNPDQFQGQEIIITGVFHYQFEDVAIYLTKNSETEEALWVNYSEKFDSSVEGLHGQKIKVKGTFDKHSKGHLGQYAGSLEDVTLVRE
jgi:hypothetical protein